MSVKIRLARGGAKKKPYYRIVVADSRDPRDGRFIERVGSYNPLLNVEDPNRVVLEQERIKYWVGVGAIPTETVEKFLVSSGLYKRSKTRQATIDLRIKASQEAKKLKEAKELEAQKAKELEAKELEAQKVAQEAEAGAQDSQVEAESKSE